MWPNNHLYIHVDFQHCKLWATDHVSMSESSEMLTLLPSHSSVVPGCNRYCVPTSPPLQFGTPAFAVSINQQTLMVRCSDGGP